MLSYPVPGLMVLNSMLEYHYLQHLLCFGVGKPALGDEVGNALRQYMHSLTGLLPNVRDKFIPMDPKMLIGLYYSSDGIKGSPGLLHIFWHCGTVVNKGLESLSIFILKHELELLPTLVVVISMVRLNV